MTVFDVCMINDEFVPISIFNTLSTFISHIQLNLFIFNGVMSSQKTQIGYCSSNICVSNSKFERSRNTTSIRIQLGLHILSYPATSLPML